jgi:AraC-like DNA-binding protein
MADASWTDAAQLAGFADSAHLSRTCRRMFGIAPTMLVPEGRAGSWKTAEKARRSAAAVA